VSIHTLEDCPAKVKEMTEIIGNIVNLLGIGREGKVYVRRMRTSVRSRRESDTVTISTEARRLLGCDRDEGASADDERVI